MSQNPPKSLICWRELDGTLPLMSALLALRRTHTALWSPTRSEG